jgi:hypothetical protein
MKDYPPNGSPAFGRLDIPQLPGSVMSSMVLLTNFQKGRKKGHTKGRGIMLNTLETAVFKFKTPKGYILSSAPQFENLTHHGVREQIQVRLLDWQLSVTVFLTLLLLKGMLGVTSTRARVLNTLQYII